MNKENFNSILKTFPLVIDNEKKMEKNWLLSY